ncbi:MAG: hypothetical protein AB1749_02590 [Pseudomonadota bacterium]
MTHSEVEPSRLTYIVERAAEIVGSNPPTNRHLECENSGEKHISRLLPHAQAAPLVAILRSAPVKDVFDRYRAHDAAAGDAQRRYKRARLVLFALLAVALAVGLGSFAIPAGGLAGWLEGYLQDRAETEALVQWASTMVVYLALLALPIVAMVMRPDGSYNRWMSERGTAEGLRRELFERVLHGAAEAGATSDHEIPLPLLVLEYFRRYQVELQAAYARTRGREHEWNATLARWFQRLVLGLLLVWGLLCIGANLSGLAEQGALNLPGGVDRAALLVSGLLQRIETYNADHYTLAIAIVLGAAYGAALLHVSSNASVRNAARYAIMRDNLVQLMREIGAVRAAAATGDEAAVRGFIARVHSVMSQENADWVRLADLDQQRDSSGVLAAALAETSSQRSTS